MTHAFLSAQNLLSSVVLFSSWQEFIGQYRGDAAGFWDGELHQPICDKED